MGFVSDDQETAAVIEAIGLTKHYGPTRAVDALSFSVAKGQVVGFLGPNGAGKSTTIRMLTGFTPPTAGRATLNGHDVTTQPGKARRQLGYLPESTPLYPELRVTEYLDYRGRLLKMPRALRRKRIDAVIDRCNLEPMRRRTIGRLSKGNKQRVGLAQALLHDPPVLVMDEPTSGFDPNQIQQFRATLEALKGRHTILLSTHILPEIEHTADRVLIISGGRLVADGSPGGLRAELAAGGKLVARVKASEASVREALGGDWVVQRAEAEGDWLRLEVTPAEAGGPGEDAERFGATCAARGWAVAELRRETPGLESLFARVTGRGGRDAPAESGTPVGGQA